MAKAKDTEEVQADQVADTEATDTPKREAPKPKAKVAYDQSKDVWRDVTNVITLPMILAPIVAVMMCDRAGLQNSVKSLRKAVTDPDDGREWSVNWEGGESDIVCQKSAGSSSQEQVFTQYERLRQAKANANHRAKGYADAYERQKETDTAAMRESTREEVERIIKASDDADRLFAEFEELHPECLLKRYSSEVSYWTGKAKGEAVTVKKYAESCEVWKEKIKAAGKDDNLKESLAACKATMDAAKARYDEYQKNIAELVKASEKLAVKPIGVETISVPLGAVVCFG